MEDELIKLLFPEGIVEEDNSNIMNRIRSAQLSHLEKVKALLAQATRTAVIEAEQNANQRFEAALGAGHEVRDAGAMSEYEDGFDHGWDMHAEAARKHWYAQLSTETAE